MLTPPNAPYADPEARTLVSSASVDSKASHESHSSKRDEVVELPAPLSLSGRSSSTGTLKLNNSPTGTSTSSKKRKPPHVRACDACAIRKVKCEQNRPCTHCVTNKISCTMMRQRKKCGPKSLHKKTLNSISSVGFPEVPVQMTGLAKYVLSDLTTADVVELLSMLQQPMIYEVLSTLTVPSIVQAWAKHVSFVNENSVNDGRILVDPTDPVFISRMAVVLTLILLLLENLIKLLPLNHPFSFEVRNLAYYNNLKHHLQAKLAEILSTLDRLLIFPSFSLQFKQQITYYNQALTSLHLFRYYQIASFNEQQKVIYLRKAITFFQLVSIPIGNKGDLSTVELHELYETIFELERFNLLFQFNLVLKDSNLLLREWLSPPLLKTSGSNTMYQMLRVLNKYDLFDDRILGALTAYALVPSTSFRGEATVESSEHFVAKVTFDAFKKEMDSKFDNKRSPANAILKNVILFKVLTFYAQDPYFRITRPLFEIIDNINDALDLSDNMISLSLSNHQVLPHLLQLLRFYIDAEQRNSGPEFTANKPRVVEFSHKIIMVPRLGYYIVDNLIESNRLLKSWYDRLPRYELAEYPEAENQWKRGQGKELDLYDVLDEMDMSNLILNRSMPHEDEMMVQAHQSQQSLNDQATLSSHDEFPPSDVPMTLGPNRVSSLTTLGAGFNMVDFNPVAMTQPAPPVITPTTIKREEGPEMSQLMVTDSTRSLYNLFHLGIDGLSTTASSNSLSNLFQSGMRDWKPPTQEEIKNNKSDFTI